MGSQFVDFDGDGRIDVLAATFDGSPHVALGTADGFAEPEHILDREGERVRLGQYWDYAVKEWRGLGSDAGHCTSAVAFDWDSDGDLDLLLGDHDAGNLYLQRNDGTRDAAGFCGTNEMVLAGGKPFALNGGMGAPRLVDWDGDDLPDVVATSFGTHDGEPGGGVYWYRNIGKPGAPEFAAAVALIPAAQSLGRVAERPNTGLYADPVDCDGDGDLDLLVGGYANWEPVAPKLSKAMALQADALASAVDALDAAMSKQRNEAVRGIDYDNDKEGWRERMDACTSSEQYQRSMQERKAKQADHDKLRPPKQREAGVWLFRRVR